MLITNTMPIFDPTYFKREQLTTSNEEWYACWGIKDKLRKLIHLWTPPQLYMNTTTNKYKFTSNIYIGYNTKYKFASVTLSEGCFSDVREPFGTKNPQHIPNSISYENCSHFWDIFQINTLFNFIYTEKDTESEYPIQNTNLYHQIYHKCQHTFENSIFLKKKKRTRIVTIRKMQIIYINCIIRKLYLLHIL